MFLRFLYRFQREALSIFIRFQGEFSLCFLRLHMELPLISRGFPPISKGSPFQFHELSLRKSLALPAKPPALYRLNKACEKIASRLPEQAQQMMNWSASQSPDQISWGGNLVCSIGFNADGERLEPESGTVLYHTFVVHKELFNGLGDT